MDWIVGNWQWILLGVFIADKVVKMTPTKKDDFVWDTVIEPILKKVGSIVAPKR